jgi:peptide/nickel transport system substrate-binding protein
VRTAHRTARRRRGFIAIAALAALGLVAGACGDKKDEDEGATGGDTAAPGVATTAGDAAETTAPATEETDATEAPEVKPVPGGKLIIAGEAEVGSPWTPEKMQCDSYCQMRARAFFEPLVAVGDDLETYPYLAESVEPNEDYTIWTVKLREGITFHDGLPLNADAAIKSLKVAGQGLLISAAYKDLAKDANGELLIEKVDDLTFTIKTGLNGDPNQPLPWPGFDVYLVGQGSFMASPAWIDAYKADPNVEAQPVGTGPFVFASYTPGDKLVVTKNPNYWQTDADGVQLPYLDEIEFRVIQDAQARQQALEAGDVDMLATSDGNVIAEFRDQAEEFPMVEQSEYTETDYTMLRLNKPGPLQDQRIRCAIDAAIDDEGLIDVIGGGILTPANGPFSPGQDGFLEDNGNPGYDPELAQQLVDEYVAEGNDPPSFLYSTVASTNALAEAQFKQEAWRAVGMNVEVVQIEQSKLITNALFGDPAFDAFGWRNHAGRFVDTQYFWWHSSSALPDGQIALNFGRLQDPVIDGLLEQQRTEVDEDARVQIAQDINRAFAEQCWISPDSWTIWGIPHKTSIQGIGLSPIPDAPEGVHNRDGAGFPGQVFTLTLWLQQ